MTVFANCLEVSSAAQGNKLIADFPDVCFTPPQAPPTPPGVPIPYPNFAMDSDLKSGTTTVKINNKTVSQENKSHFKSVKGDEAGAAPKKGVITSTNRGKAYNQMWSMNVKAQGKGLARFSDIATSNHRSNTGDSPPMPLVGKPGTPGYLMTDDCIVGQYKEIKAKCNERGGQAHHIIPDEYLRTGKRPASAGSDQEKRNEKVPSIDEGCAICVGGSAEGKASAERTSKEGEAVTVKGQTHAAKGGAAYHTGRGHGYMHYYFDGTAKKEQPITAARAVEIANETLTNVGQYDGATVSPECAEVGKTCVNQQMSAAAADPNITMSGNSGITDERIANYEKTLSREGTMKPGPLTTTRATDTGTLAQGLKVGGVA